MRKHLVLCRKLSILPCKAKLAVPIFLHFPQIPIFPAFSSNSHFPLFFYKSDAAKPFLQKQIVMDLSDSLQSNVFVKWKRWIFNFLSDAKMSPKKNDLDSLNHWKSLHLSHSRRRRSHLPSDFSDLQITRARLRSCADFARRPRYIFTWQY